MALAYSNMSAEEQEVFEKIRRDSDIDTLHDRLESKPQNTDYAVPRAALRYIVTCNSSRIVSIQDPKLKQRVLDFIEAVMKKTGGGFIQCAACGNPIPHRGALDDDRIGQTMAIHLTGGCWR